MSLHNPSTKLARIKSLILLLSGCALCFLCIPVPIVDTWKKLIIILPLTCWVVKKTAAQSVPAPKVLRSHAVALLCSAALAAYLGQAFYYRWLPHDKVNMVAYLLRMPVELLVILTCVVLTVAALPVLASLCCLVYRSNPKTGSYEIPGEGEGKRSKWFSIAVCFLSAVGIITMCSTSSPLYPFNEWVDAHCFFTVGKSMMNGMVVYRDLFEQKGPFLYFLHSLAWLVSHDTFLGVYLLEILAAFFFLYFSYRTCCLFAPANWSNVLIPIAALIAYTSEAFSLGDSVEELCLPFFAYAIFISARSQKAQTPISVREYFVIGVTSGLVFWSKFTLVGFYLGWFFVPLIQYLRLRQWKALFSAIVAVASGVLLVTIPFVVYFGINHAIVDWLTVYLYDNLFLYTVDTGLWENLRTGNLKAMEFAKYMVTAAAFSLPYLYSRKDQIWFYHMLSMLLFTFLFQFMGGRNYQYYAFVFATFVPLGLLSLVSLLSDCTGMMECIKFPRFVVGLVTAVCIGLAMMITPNRTKMGVPREALPQYQFKAVIDQYENPTLLNYGFLDSGFYTACNIIPNCKSFCKLNAPIPEMYQLQDDYVANGVCDFVVTCNRLLEVPHYECVAQADSTIDGEIYTYYLYQRR